MDAEQRERVVFDLRRAADMLESEAPPLGA